MGREKGQRDTFEKESADSRIIIEHCCSTSSLLGKLAPKGCGVIRLTKETDMTTKKEMDYAKEMINNNRGHKMLLWGAIPCT
eukprot:8658095-Prorocentrum_lima.AAC.1